LRSPSQPASTECTTENEANGPRKGDGEPDSAEFVGDTVSLSAKIDQLMLKYAHTIQDQPPESWEPLEDHLQLVAEFCSRFAASFDAKDFGFVLGMWHDLGKYSKEFQAYLHQANGFEANLENVSPSMRVDHSTAGAQLADRLFGKHPYGRILAYCIAGHHAGLADAMSASGVSGLDRRLAKVVPDVSDAPVQLQQKPVLADEPPICLGGDDVSVAFQLAFFTRMLFSCLVDGDYLATEAFMSPEKVSERRIDVPHLSTLREILGEHLQELSAGKQGAVADARTDVLNACLRAASSDCGLFSLTVPTGGGKTLSSLAFALAHAETHEMARVIYAIPFTSIIEQTANVFRDVFADVPDVTILEHHSNTDPDRETPTTRLVTQNWDVPIVVTTNVQLFESLFASRTSSCRKLHNICNSVIILDEVQAIPVDLLRPTLAVIQELVRNYRCTVVLCTATQPALGKSEDFRIGLSSVTEIIPNPPQLFERLKRVQISHIGPQSDEQLTGQLIQYDQFLCIVNTRPHAANLFARLTRLNDADKKTNSLFHLSTCMCGQHRKQVLDTIRQRLQDDLSCQVVSTQLIEAGVDVDFPVVFRSLAGVDSIAQAAGRCNREGRQATGQVFVFESTEIQLRGYLKATADSAAELMADLQPEDMDLLNQDIVRRYFDLHFWRHSDRWDAKQVMNCFPDPYHTMQFNFQAAAKRFQWIDDVSKTVFVPYNVEARRLIKELRRLHDDVQQISMLRKVLRQLQRYSVNLFPQIFNAMVGTDIEVLDSGYAILTNESCYDRHLGFRPDKSGYHEPNSLII